MGFGHRVYKNFDPRATVMRETCHEVLNELGISDPLLDVAMALEKVALEDPYFIEKKLYPNVDFYSGIILKAIGIPQACLLLFLQCLEQLVGLLIGMRCYLSQVKKLVVLAKNTPVKLTVNFVPLNKR